MGMPQGDISAPAGIHCNVMSIAHVSHSEEVMVCSWN